MLSALLIGRNDLLTWMLPQLLFRAGFCVDTITASSLLSRSKFVRRCDMLGENQPFAPAIARRLQDPYDWIIVTDDRTLGEVLHSDLSIEEKLKVLPVLKEENFFHLFSNIGLSTALSSQGVKTPAFFVAQDALEVFTYANELGYPILVKIDASGGGAGVFECQNHTDIKALPAEIFKKPVLVQKKIVGKEVDLSAIYLKGELVHFSYGRIDKVCRNRFGPSVIRTYRPLSEVSPQIFHELSEIGKALGAHGMTNIACIECEETERFYFEVDMRPNVWIEAPRYFGEDPAERIQKWFSCKETLHDPVQTLPNALPQMKIPCFLRLNFFELVLNRHRVWKFIPKDDPKLVARVLLISIWVNVKIWILKITPKKCHPVLKKLNCLVKKLK